MHCYVRNELAKPDARSEALLDRTVWLFGVPRLILWCRIAGHRAVVDGVGDSRWVCCDRCGVRPERQGCLDPDVYAIGQRYLGPYRPGAADETKLSPSDGKRRFEAPGWWPESPVGDVGGELVLGKHLGGVGAGIEIGSAGSDQTVSMYLRLHHLGAIYLHTERHGCWLQRRLNHGHHDREINIDFHEGRLWWRMWAKRGEWSNSTPRWQDGSIRILPRTRKKMAADVPH